MENMKNIKGYAEHGKKKKRERGYFIDSTGGQNRNGRN